MPTFNYFRRAIKPKGKIVYEYNPLYNYRPIAEEGEIDDLVTKGESQLNFDLEHPVDIVCLKSYDGSVNLILNDNKNLPRLINTRFTVRENNTYERVDRTGNTDTNLYDESEFEIDTSLLKKYINIPKVSFEGIHYGGNLPVGNYVFYFKLSDGDGNETDFVAESGLITIHMGALDDPFSIRGGQLNENSGKSIQFILTNIDSGYDYISVYYSRTTGADNLDRQVNAVKILDHFRVRQNVCSIHITGSENCFDIPVETLSLSLFLASSAKTLEVCLNMLFLGNVKKYTPLYETLSKLSLGFLPFYESKSEEDELGERLTESYVRGGYYNVKNIYNKVGYWNEEIYRFGIVYIMANGSLSPVYNIRGINNVPKNGTTGDYTAFDDIQIDYATLLINNATLENSAGVCRIIDTNTYENYFLVRHFVFKVANNEIIKKLKELNIKGYFFVRLKRIPTILCQAFVIGRDSYSGIPAWELSRGASENQGVWVTESFITLKGYISHDYEERLLVLDKNNVKVGTGICPEFELNLAYYNNLFTGNEMKVKPVSVVPNGLNGSTHHVFVKGAAYPSYISDHFINAKVTSIPDGGYIRDGATVFRNIAGSPNENTFLYISSKSVKPSPSQFDSSSSAGITFVNGIPNITGSSNETKVKIARGIYSPYIGIYNTTLIHSNSLINIYIPGYDINQMSDYFKMRINTEDPYYPVTLRTSINEFNEYDGEHVYRGDCFISLFTHRINRNFQDPDAPGNDVIVDESTWLDKYDSDTDATDEINRGDLNAVKLGTYITIKCYTSTNVAMRDWDGSNPGEESLMGGKRTFYPLSALRVDGHSKIPQSDKYNLGFSSTTSERMNFLQPYVPYIKNVFETRVIYSNIALNDAFKNGYRIFKGSSYVDYSNQYGGITKLVEWNGNLIIIFEHAIALAQVNEKVLLLSKDGSEVVAASNKPLATTPIMISTDFGSLWPESICKTDSYIYGVDTVGKKIWRTNGQSIDFISEFKVLKFLNENISLSEQELTPIIGIRNVKTHYNAFKHDVMFTFYDNTYGFEEKVWNLCYNEYLAQKDNGFITFYSWIPSYSANIDNIFFSYDRNASKWISKLGSSIKGTRELGNGLIGTTWTIDLQDPDSSNYGSINNNSYRTTINPHADGICMYNPLIGGTTSTSGSSVVNIDPTYVFSRELYLENRPIPEGLRNSDYYLEFELERDNFGFYNYFEIVETGHNNVVYNGQSTQLPTGLKLKIKNNLNYNYITLLRHWFTINGLVKDPIIPCIQLNIKCNIYAVSENSDPNSWVTYQINNTGFYESQVYLTLYDIYNNKTRTRENGRWSGLDTKQINIGTNIITLPTFETKFWKHGFAGLIDVLDRIKPCFWYGKQHPFEFEFLAGNDNAGYKQFDNLIISSNNVAPESIHYTIIGDSYDFAQLKPAMYFRQEATKAIYLYNGADILYDHAVFDRVTGYTPEMITSNDYIERDLNNNPLRNRDAVSTTYKDTLFPLIYARQDTFNEVEDFYKKRISSPTYSDYPNITGGEIQWDLILDQFSICNHVKCRDIKEVGRIRGNIQYVEDKWHVLISPLVVLNRNNTWIKQNNKWIPKLVLSNIPTLVYEYVALNGGNASIPQEINTLLPEGDKYSGNLTLDFTEWSDIANKRTEVKLLDKFIKTKIRYKGDKLVTILATVTNFNTTTK